MQLPVLLYHHIGTRLPGSWPGLTLSPAAFEEQLRWLKRNEYTGIHTREWLGWVRRTGGLPNRPVLLTFDDAYEDLVKTALPLLSRYGFKATVFVVSQHIGSTSSWDQRLGYPARKLMTRDQIRHWAAGGVFEFAAHSRTHPDLRTLSTLEIKNELRGSRNDLEELLCADVNSFSYPYGSFDERVLDCAREVFDLAFTSEEGLNSFDADLYKLRRVVVDIDKELLFACIVRLGRNPAELFRSFGRHIGDRMARIGIIR